MSLRTCPIKLYDLEQLSVYAEITQRHRMNTLYNRYSRAHRLFICKRGPANLRKDASTRFSIRFGPTYKEIQQKIIYRSI